MTHTAFVFSILMVCNRPILTSDYLKGDCEPFFDNINNHDHKKEKVLKLEIERKPSTVSNSNFPNVLEFFQPLAIT